MKLSELYNQIQNSIDDPKIMARLIEAYATCNGRYYSQLTRMTVKEQTKGRYYVQDADRFYAMLFNKWKNSILAMTREEFIELYKQGSYGQDFVKMRKYLKGVPDVTTMKEANEVFYGKKDDAELQKALGDYSWRSLGEGSGWVHVCSRYLTAKKDKYPDIEHRLYVNTESLDTYKMVTYLVEKFDEHHLIYYFKFDLYADCDDTIVIYSSTEDLAEYLEILQEIKKEHPDLVARIKEPPILTGKIDGWIGYGSEPARKPDGSLTSFNTIRAELLESSIRRVTIDFILHTNARVSYHDKVVSFMEFVTVKSVETLLSNLEKRYIAKVESNKKHGNEAESNPHDIEDKLGYTLEDIHSASFAQMIYQSIKGHITSLLIKIANKSYSNSDAIPIPLKNGKEIIFDNNTLEQVIKQMAAFIAKNNPDFINNVQNYGVDSNKFCFDIKAKAKIDTFTKQEAEATLVQNNAIDKTNLDAKNICSIKILLFYKDK